MTHTIQLPIRNVTCEACEKVIGRMLEKFPQARVESISPDAQTLALTCEEADVSAIKEKLRAYNYLNEDPAEKTHFWFTLQSILAGKTGFEAENRLLTHTLGLVCVLFLVLGIAYLGWFNRNESFLKIWPVLALIPLGIAANAGALAHVRRLQHHFNCTNGMMTGMIIGMISGFMAGAILGATNGMFTGSVVGMGIGMGASAYAVRKTGVMGVLEGLMAGLMAGTMGAMLSVMMLNDHPIAFLYILFGACTLVLGGMSYFLVKEIGPIQGEGKSTGFIPLALTSVLVLLALLALILWGPQSIFTIGGI